MIFAMLNFVEEVLGCFTNWQVMETNFFKMIKSDFFYSKNSLNFSKN